MVTAIVPWLPLIIAVIGIGGTLLASWVGYRNSLRVERARWERDDQIRQEQVEREARDRYNLERIRSYTDFLATGVVALAGPPPAQVGGTPEQRAAREAATLDAFLATLANYQRAYFATRMLATPAVAEAAHNLYSAITPRPQEGNSSEKVLRARSAFIDAAQAELGVPLTPMKGDRV